MLKNGVHKINNNYGSKRGFARYLWIKVLTLIGYYNKYSEVDWSRVERFVFVCYGNICRSSLAEGVAKSMGVKAVSMGIDCREGAEADPRAIAFAKGVGIDLTQHRTQSLSSTDILSGDLIVVMEPAHIKNFNGCLNDDVQLTLAGLWCANVCAYIHDPYNSNETYFANCEQRVISASQALATRYK